MNDTEKLAKIKSHLERVIFPDETTHNDEYWEAVQCEIDNAVDASAENDAFHKILLGIINGG